MTSKILAISIIPLFLISFTIGLFLTIIAIWITKIQRWVYTPQSNRWNKNIVSLHGGIALFSTFLIVVALTFELDTISQTLAFILLPMIMAFIGFVDDVYYLNPATKLTAEIIVAMIAIGNGISFVIFDNIVLDGIISLVWIIGVINALNLIDNMDGVATGICLLITLYLGFFAYSSIVEITQFSVIISGVLLAFLIFNFNPAKIFMGDSGSLFLGTFISLILIKYGASLQIENTLLISYSNFFIPVFVLFIPILDTLFVSINRIIKGLPIYQGDKGHIAHRLSFIFKNDKISAAILYIYQIIILVFVFFNMTWMLLVLVFITICSMVYLTTKTNHLVWPSKVE